MTTYYLNADSGSNSGGGGSGSPWKTLVYAVANSTTNDTIYCQNSASSYSFANTTITSRNIIGESINGVVFDGGGSSLAWTFYSGSTSIQNLWFKNIIRTSVGCIIGHGSEYPTASLTINNCRFTNCQGSSDSSNGGLIGCHGWMNGIVNIIVSYCIFDDVTLHRGSGNNECILFTMKGSYSESTFVFNNCVFFFETGNLQALALLGTYMGYCSYILNNCILRNTQVGIGLFGSNNYGPQPVLNNCTYSGAWSMGTATLNNCITLDPLFIDEINGNFHLRPNSPCIGAGVII